MRTVAHPTLGQSLGSGEIWGRSGGDLGETWGDMGRCGGDLGEMAYLSLTQLGSITCDTGPPPPPVALTRRAVAEEQRSEKAIEGA